MDKLYFFFLPFVNAFNFSSILIIPLIISIINFIEILFTNKFRKLKFLDYTFLLFLIIICISIILNIKHVNEKFINHSLSYLAIIIFFYYIPTIILKDISVKIFFKIITYSYIIILLFGIIEFICANFFYIDFSFIPRPTVQSYYPTFFGILIRARSIFEESGYFASYIAIVSPLVFYYLKITQSKKLLIFSTILFVFAIFTAFSVSFFMFFPLAIIISFIIQKGLNIFENKKLLFSFLLFIVIITIVYYFYNEEIDYILEEAIISKFYSYSFYDRYNKFIENINVFVDSDILHLLFGYAPGSYKYLKIEPAISFYINLLRDLGVVGLFSFLLVNVISFIFILRSKKIFSKYIMVSFILMHMFFISNPNYFYPYYLLIYVLIYNNYYRKVFI
jgi:hypothetical protein